MKSLYNELEFVVAEHDGRWKYRTGAGERGASIHFFHVGDSISGVVSGRNEILRAWTDGTVLLDSCGWHTPTTSMAWNAALRLVGYHVESRNKRYRLYGHGRMDDFEVVTSGLYPDREVLIWKDN